MLVDEPQGAAAVLVTPSTRTGRSASLTNVGAIALPHA